MRWKHLNNRWVIFMLVCETSELYSMHIQEYILYFINVICILWYLYITGFKNKSTGSEFTFWFSKFVWRIIWLLENSLHSKLTFVKMFQVQFSYFFFIKISFFPNQSFWRIFLSFSLSLHDDFFRWGEIDPIGNAIRWDDSSSKPNSTPPPTENWLCKIEQLSTIRTKRIIIDKPIRRWIVSTNEKYRKWKRI